MCSALIDTGSKLYNLGQNDNGLCLEIAKFMSFAQEKAKK